MEKIDQKITYKKLSVALDFL